VLVRKILKLLPYFLVSIVCRYYQRIGKQWWRPKSERSNLFRFNQYIPPSLMVPFFVKNKNASQEEEQAVQYAPVEGGRNLFSGFLVHVLYGYRWKVGFIHHHFRKCFREKFKGRLHFCSHSLVFVPDDTRFSITRHCFDKIEGGFKKFKPTSSSQPFFSSFADENLFCFNCTEFVEIRKGNKDHPYIFKKVCDLLLSESKLMKFVVN